jgi:hypothetical protein
MTNKKFISKISSKYIFIISLIFAVFFLFLFYISEGRTNRPVFIGAIIFAFCVCIILQIILAFYKTRFIFYMQPVILKTERNKFYLLCLPYRPAIIAVICIATMKYFILGNIAYWEIVIMLSGTLCVNFLCGLFLICKLHLTDEFL